MPKQLPRARRLAESNIEEENEYSRQKSGIHKKRKMVGPPRFELGTSCPPDKRATKLRHGPTQRKSRKTWGALDSISNAFFRKLDLFIVDASNS